MTFDEWFTAQHGRRERSKHHISDDDLHTAVMAGASAKEELDRREQWDRMRRSALYAWQVRDGDKK